MDRFISNLLQMYLGFGPCRGYWDRVVVGSYLSVVLIDFDSRFSTVFEDFFFIKSQLLQILTIQNYQDA